MNRRTAMAAILSIPLSAYLSDNDSRWFKDTEFSTLKKGDIYYTNGYKIGERIKCVALRDSLPIIANGEPTYMAMGEVIETRHSNGRIARC